MSYHGMGDFEVMVEGAESRDPAANTYGEMSEAMDAMIMAARSTGSRALLVSPPGSDTIVADVMPGGRPRQYFSDDQSASDDALRQLDEAAITYGREIEQRAQQAAQQAAQQTRLPVSLLGAGAGAIAGAFLLKNRTLGALGGAVAGYAAGRVLS